MPELPDIENYVEALAERVVGRPLLRLTVHHPFLLRSAAPRPEDLAGREVRGVRRMGKRIILAFEGDLFAALHLMIAGRLQWKEGAPAVPPGRLPRSSVHAPTGAIGTAERGAFQKRGAFHPRPAGEGAAGHLAVPGRHAAPHRGGHAAAGGPAPAGRRGGAGRRSTAGGLELLEADLAAFDAPAAAARTTP